ncbi:alpha/beta hydrolase family protein [Streptomyces sp. NPDC054796]
MRPKSTPTRTTRTTRTQNRVALVTAVAALAGAATLVPQQAQAGPGNPYERGPAPTEASVTAERGPFAVSQKAVPESADGRFNKGTVYYPTDTSQGTFGAVAISPGFVSPEAAVGWLGPRLASQGFVVMTLETNTPLDFPDQRADQLLGALDWLTTLSDVRDRIDASRLAVAGHSMGGGASLRASEKRPTLQAAVPLTPWHTDKTWEKDPVPTLVVGAENDAIAPVAEHAEPFYGSLSAAPEKAYLELEGADHLAPVAPNVTVAKYAISWLKRYVDDDTRYEQFLCPPPRPSSTISEYRDTCPGS